MNCLICDTPEHVVPNALVDQEGETQPLCAGCLQVVRHFAMVTLKKGLPEPKRNLEKLSIEELHDLLDELVR